MLAYLSPYWLPIDMAQLNISSRLHGAPLVVEVRIFATTFATTKRTLCVSELLQSLSAPTNPAKKMARRGSSPPAAQLACP